MYGGEGRGDARLDQLTVTRHLGCRLLLRGGGSQSPHCRRILQSGGRRSPFWSSRPWSWLPGRPACSVALALEAGIG